MPALVAERENIAAFTHRMHMRIESFVDEDAAIAVDGAEDVGLPAFGSRDIVADVKVVELDLSLRCFSRMSSTGIGGSRTIARACSNSASSAAASRSIASSAR
jgi:hypothetical protein